MAAEHDTATAGGASTRLAAALGAVATACVAMAFRPADAALPDGSEPVTFARIAAAESSLDLRVRQLRRVLEADRHGSSRWTSMLESLVVSPDPATGVPRFALELDAIDADGGAALPPAELQRRRAVFHGQAGYLHRHGSLHVGDPALAAANYTIVQLDTRTRLGRPTQRVAVLPRRIGRNPWVLEVDSATGYPLFRAELDGAGRVVSTLEVVAFERVDAASLADVDWWEPQRTVREFEAPAEGIEAAATSVDSPLAAADPSSFVVPTIDELPAGYVLDGVRVVQDELRPESSLVLTYTDGIDDFFVVQTANVPPPSLPAPAGSQDAYAIFVYHEHNVAQLMFHAKGVQTMVVGRSGPLLLAPLAQDLLARRLGV